MGVGHTIAREETIASNNATQEFIFNSLEESNDYALEAFSQALRTINDLGKLDDLEVPTVDVPNIPLNGVAIPEVGDAPAAPVGLEINSINLPSEPVLDDVSLPDFTSEPTFTKEAPVLADIAPPDPFSGTIPNEPAINEIAVPSDLDIVFPDVPALRDLNLPAAPTIDMPTIDATIGDVPIASFGEFEWSEVVYQSTLLDAMNSRLLEFVSGASTGLTPEVEAAIWDRARQREFEISEETIDQVNRSTAAKGFKTPTGVTLRLVQQAIQDRANKESTFSRDVMIKQAELEQENFRFAFSTAVQLESKLIDHFNTVQNRAFEAAKFGFQVAIDIYNARVLAFRAEIEGIRLKVEVFRAKVEGELAKLEIFKGQLEGQRLINDINESTVRIYATQVDALKAKVDVFRTQVQAAATRIEAEKAKIDMYRARIEAYGDLVRAKATEFQGYAERIRAETVKVDAYRAEAEAFRSRAGAYESLVKSKLGVAELDVKISQEVPLNVYRAKVDAARTAIEAQAAELRAKADVYKSQVDAFSAEEGAVSDRTRAAADAYRANIQALTAEIDASVKAAEVNIRAAISNREITAAALRAVAQVSGQLAAAALAAKNVSASLVGSSTLSASAADSASEATSCSTSTSYNNSSDLTPALIEGPPCN